MTDITQEFAMSMYASTADRNAAMLAEIERLRDQLHLAEVVRAAQVEGLTQGAAGWRERANQLEAEVAGLRARLALHDSCNGRMTGEPPRYTPECAVLRAEVAGLREPLPGVLDSDCNYMAVSGRVCNKCGHIHHGIGGGGK